VYTVAKIRENKKPCCCKAFCGKRRKKEEIGNQIDV
jgi:hypothetical protein